jgi:hypothetical protein
MPVREVTRMHGTRWLIKWHSFEVCYCSFQAVLPVAYRKRTETEGARFEGVFRRIFGPKGEEVTGTGENFILRNFVICMVTKN